MSVLRLSLDVMVREGETRRGQLVEVGGVGEGEVVCPKRRAHVIDLACAVSTWALARGGWGGWGGRTAMKSTFGLEGAATLLLVSAPPERTIAAIVPIALA